MEAEGSEGIPGLVQKALAVISSFRLKSFTRRRSSMNRNRKPASSSFSFGVIFDKALRAYKKKTKEDLPFILLPPSHKHVILS
jgi:hypothetical protein